jgi:acetylglutamate kinase
MDQEQANRFIESGVISDGMIPKMNSAFKALSSGVNKVHLIDGRVKHSLLLEIFTDEGVGTELLMNMQKSKVME